jgi:pantoate kinase
VKYHYIRELIQNGHVKVMKIEVENNPTSDVLTKNAVEKIQQQAWTRDPEWRH